MTPTLEIGPGNDWRRNVPRPRLARARAQLDTRWCPVASVATSVSTRIWSSRCSHRRHFVLGQVTDHGGPADSDGLGNLPRALYIGWSSLCRFEPCLGDRFDLPSCAQRLKHPRQRMNNKGASSQLLAMLGHLRRPSASIPSGKSRATTSAPAAEIGAELVAVPTARSKTPASSTRVNRRTSGLGGSCDRDPDSGRSPSRQQVGCDRALRVP